MAEQLNTVRATLSVEQRIALAREGEGWLGDKSVIDPKLRKYFLQIVAYDAEVRVRQALAETLASNPDAPRALVLQLAQDVDLVAASLLAASQVLTDSDLVAIVQNHPSPKKLSAIARRSSVSQNLSTVLIELGDLDSVTQLIENPGADISESGFVCVIDRYGERKAIQSGLVSRKILPPAIVERVARLVSDDLLGRLLARHEISPEVSSQIVCEVRDRAALGLATGLSSESLLQYIEHLESRGAISYSLLLRSLCVGHIEFLIHVIAMRRHVSVDYVRGRFTRSHGAEIKSLWEQAKLPESLREVAAGVIEVLLQSELEFEKSEYKDYRARIIERVLMLCANVGVEFGEDDINFIIDSRMEDVPVPSA